MRGPAAAGAAPSGTRRSAAGADIQQPAALPPAELIVLQYERLLPCQLLRRYKRFLGDVQLGGTEAAAPAMAAQAQAAAAATAATAAAAAAIEAAAVQAGAGAVGCTVVHVPNTGSMAGLLGALPAAALLSASADPKRKYAHTHEFIQLQGGTWVGVHSAKANAMVRALLQAQALPGLPPYSRIQQEVKFGADGKSRVDFVLHREPQGEPSSAAQTSSSSGGAMAAAVGVAAAAAAVGASNGAPAAKRRRGSKAAAAAAAAATAVQAGEAATAAAGAGAMNTKCCYLEVKASTLAEDREDGGGRIAMFPDAVSERAQRHVRELTALAKAGASAALVFAVLRDDCNAWAPCHERDPAYGRLVREAAAAGVRLLPVVCALDEGASAVRFRGTLPVDLDYKWAG
ncbi:hypothetical protein COHA_001803 [Chlorella ohadii]|uniref:Sugar fermentation stimulation protein C-terminal domain-containing protein n=1 Tax=Chlorella ohadii TaxID=2649997 RepID=A0AAD5H8L2_9CHLO|nr:hypothetical protein COHA_001803 [Chlorella ohadii]